MTAGRIAGHLLRETLRGALGEQVKWRGIQGGSNRIQIVFSHADELGPEELNRIEAEVNAAVCRNDPVEIDGIGGFAGDVGLFKIVSQDSPSEGVRRIEAAIGAAAIEEVQRCFETVAGLAKAMKVSPDRLPERLKRLQDEVADLHRKVDEGESGSGRIEDAPPAKRIGGVDFIGMVLSGVPGNDLPPMIDEHKASLGSGVVALVSEVSGKAAVAVGVTADLVDRMSAMDLVRAATKPIGGKGGGGRPELARSGGPNPAGAEEAIAAVERMLEACALDEDRKTRHIES